MGALNSFETLRRYCPEDNHFLHILWVACNSRHLTAMIFNLRLARDHADKSQSRLLHRIKQLKREIIVARVTEAVTVTNRRVWLVMSWQH